MENISIHSIFEKNVYSEIDNLKEIFCKNKSMAIYEIFLLILVLLLVLGKNLLNLKKNATRVK